MKKTLLLSVFTLLLQIGFSKKVKFAVDMTGQTISAFGMHVSGDFQEAAGYPLNWESNSTPLTQEGTTDIYSIVVDIPAFNKYEYKFVNGDQFYDAEFVPEESRVGYNFNDNRWIYIDSLNNDTTFVGAILFGGNAPAGLNLARFKVNMAGINISTDGVRMAGTFQSWNPMKLRLYSFEPDIYEVICYMASGNYEYLFFNGYFANENVPSTCAVNGNRPLQSTADLVLDPVCFNTCTVCFTGIQDISYNENMFTVSPNPASTSITVTFNTTNQRANLILTDATGRMVWNAIYSGMPLMVNTKNFTPGVYIIQSSSETGNSFRKKLIIQ